MNPQNPLQPTQPQVPAQPSTPAEPAQQPQQFNAPSAQPAPTLFAPDVQHGPSQPAMGAFGAGMPIVTTPQKTGPNKKLIGIVAGVILLATIGGVVAISGSKKETAPLATTSPSSDSSLVDTTPEASEEEKTPAVEATTTTIDKTLVADLGLTIKATKMTRNFQQKDFASANPDQEAIVLELTATSSEGYSVVVGATDFKLVTSDGKEYGRAAVLRDLELKEAGFVPWPGGAAKKDSPVTGVVAFGVPKNSTSLTLRYKQREIKVIGANARTIPAKNVDVQLVP